MATKHAIQRSGILNLLRCRCSPAAATLRTYCTAVESTDEEEREREKVRIAQEASLDEPPTTCCQSGCSNCVFIVWAEALTNKMDAGGPEVAKKVLELVDDPSLKAYLEMELRIRGLMKSRS